jgi:hypothetical protein
VRKVDKSKSPKRLSISARGRAYGTVGLGRPGVGERGGIPKFLVEGENEDDDGETRDEKDRGLVASTSAGSFLSLRANPANSGPLFAGTTPSFLNVGPDSFMRRVSYDTVSGSDGEASVNGTPTRRGSVGTRRASVQPRPSLPAAGTRSAQPAAGRQLPFAPGKSLPPLGALRTGQAPVRSALPVANWRLVTPSPSLSSLASSLTDTPSAPARTTNRASPILSKCRRPPQPQLHQPILEPEPTVVLGRLEREYTTVQQIGKGTFGQVLKVEKDGRLFAVKRSKPFEGVRHRRRVLEEVDILRHLSQGQDGHPNVLRFVDAWEQDGRSLILTEMCELGNLADFLMEWGERFARLDEARVWKIASDLCHVSWLSFIKWRC